MDRAQIEAQLPYFTGTDNWYKHQSGLLYTDGVKFIADHAGAYWLIDLIASYQKRCRKDRMLRQFQIWILGVERDYHRGCVSCLRDTDNLAFQQTIPFTDFPLPEITFYLENEVLCLPSER